MRWSRIISPLLRAPVLVVGLLLFGGSLSSALAGFSISCGKCCICAACCASGGSSSSGSSGGSFWSPPPDASHLRPAKPKPPRRSKATRAYEKTVAAEKLNLPAEIIPLAARVPGRDIPLEDETSADITRKSLHFRWGRPDFGNSPYASLAFAPEGQFLAAEKQDKRLHQSLSILATASQWQDRVSSTSPEDSHFLASEAAFAMLGMNLRVSVEADDKPLYGVPQSAFEEFRRWISEARNAERQLDAFKQGYEAALIQLAEKKKRVSGDCLADNRCSGPNEVNVMQEISEASKRLQIQLQTINRQNDFIEERKREINDKIRYYVELLPNQRDQ